MNKRIASLILSLALVFCFTAPDFAFAYSGSITRNTVFNAQSISSENDEPEAEKAASVSVFSGDELLDDFDIEEDGNITYALRSAFDYCTNNLEDGKLLTVRIPEGVYSVNYALTISSNTVLDLTDNVVLVDASSNIFISQSGVEGYNGTHDFTVLGGRLTYIENDSSYNGCLVRLAHAKNIKFENTVFSNNKNSHHIELAACKDISFNGCTFENMQADISQTSGEALQIDILEENEHFKLMPEYDGTVNDGITVNNCIFRNLLRGVGTQSAYAGLYQKHIKITNCTFENIQATAISCMNYIDSTVSNNVITNCGEGIKYYLMMSDANLGKMYYIEDNCSINTNCNTVISGNNISVVKNAVMKSASPIYVFGNNITSEKGAAFKTGNYYVGNISITGNTINTPEYGIRIYDVKNSNISKNRINGVSAVNGTNGVYADEDCDSNRINENTIKGFENGINIKNKSDSNTVSRNVISNPAKNGIILQSGVKSNTVTSNTISSASSNGIFSNGSKSTVINSNTVSKSRGHGVCIMNSSEITKLASNKITESTENGIYTKASKLSSVSSNTVSKTKSSGVCIMNGSEITKLDSNKITDSAKNGIYCSSSKLASVSSNTISKSKSHGICIVGKCAVTKLNSNRISESSKNGVYMESGSKITDLKSNTISKSGTNGISTYGSIGNISSNTFTSNSWGIYFASGTKNSVYKNTYNSNKKGACYCDGKKGYKFSNLSAPSVSLSQKSRAATVKWKKASNATSYEIYRSTSKNGAYSKIKTVSSKTLSFKNTRLSKGKTYYYKVRAIRKINSTTLYSPYSSVKSIKIK